MVQSLSIAPKNAIDELAAIYKEKTRKIVFWVGAGLSKPAKIPDWNELREMLLDTAETKAMSLTEGTRDEMRREIVEASEEPNNWKFFEKIRKTLGETTFLTAIRSHVSKSDSLTVPHGYEVLFNIENAGIITTNIDKFPERVFRERSHGRLSESNSKDLGRKNYSISNSDSFLVYLHGTYDDPSTWVFTQSEFSSLRNSAPYRNFLSRIFSQYTVVFVGVSADDDGASGMLSELISVDIDVGPHFWLTDRRDRATDEWCENNHVFAIRYDSTKHIDTHLQALIELTELIRDYQPREPSAPPVIAELISAQESIDSPDVLSRIDDIDQIRLQLSSHAKYLLTRNHPHEQNEDAYLSFCREYRRAIHTSWLVDTGNSGEKLFNYNVLGKIKSGAFGDIFHATDQGGKQVAIKMLRQEVQDDTNMTKSFRRGIQSMRILTNEKLKGCVQLYDAYELPPCIVMEFIEGLDLGEAIEINLVSGYLESLQIALDVANIVENGHRLRERVLHRDLRPANIMLENIDYSEKTYDVKVLDFDLSWHKGAWDRSISSTAHSALGFLAPEQTMQMGKDKTRSTLVDSHGLGATLFFMLTRDVPEAGYFYRENHVDIIYGRLPESSNEILKCLKNRCHRIICDSTMFDQDKRLSFSKLKEEIETLIYNISNEREIHNESLLAEEFICRALDGLPYHYDDRRGRFHASLQSGVTIQVGPDYNNREIQMEISFVFGGVRNWKNVNKYLPDNFNKSKATLTKAGWNTSPVTGAGQDRHMSASASASSVSASLADMAKTLSMVIEDLNFD